MMSAQRFLAVLLVAFGFCVESAYARSSLLSSLTGSFAPQTRLLDGNLQRESSAPLAFSSDKGLIFMVGPGQLPWRYVSGRDANTGMAPWVYQMTPHDEWDYDGVNENLLADIEVDGEMRKVLVHFDRNGFGYTPIRRSRNQTPVVENLRRFVEDFTDQGLDRVTGELLVAEKYDPATNWATHVDMETGRPSVVAQYSTRWHGEDVNTTNVCPAALGSKDQQPAAFSPEPACSTCRRTTCAWTTGRSSSSTLPASPTSAPP